MAPSGTFALSCICIVQLMTHTAIHTLPFALQLCYKPLSILQRVTKSLKVHISNHNRFYITRQKIIFARNTKKVTENWFCNKIGSG